MKHLLSLERLDVGRTLALTVGSPSAHRRGTMLKHYAFMLLFLLGSLNVWGEDVTDEFIYSSFSPNSTTYGATTIQGTATTSGTAYSAFTNLAGTNYFGIRGYKKTNSSTTYAGIISTTTNGDLKSVTVTINTATSTSNRKVYIYGKTSAYSAISDLFDDSKKGTLIQEITYTSGTTKYTVTIPSNSSYQYVGITTNNNLVGFDKIQITWDDGQGGSGSGNPTVSLTSLALNPASVWLAKGGSVTLSPVYTPDNATNKNVTWSSSNTSVATVTSAGVVTASSTNTGTATITCTSAQSSSIKATCTVTVANGDVLTASNLNYSNYTSWTNKKGTGNVAVYAGESSGGGTKIQLRATNPSGIVSTTSAGKIKNVSVVWDSGSTNTSRTVDIYGKNSAYSTGADLYSNSSSTQGTKIGSIAYPATTCTLSSTDYEYVGIRSNTGALYLTSITFFWEAIPTHTLNYGMADGCGSMGSLSATVNNATVSSGSAVKEGAMVTLVPTINPGYEFVSWSTTAGSTITNYVFTMPTSDETITLTLQAIPLTALTLNESSLDLAVNDEVQLSVASVTPSGALTTVNWSTSDGSVATVVDGLVKAKGDGTATITATSTITGSVKATCTVTVTTPEGIAEPTLTLADNVSHNAGSVVKVSNHNEEYIYAYTLDGTTTPALDANLDPVDNVFIYDHTNGITLSATCTLKIVAYDIDGNHSDVVTKNYTINPAATVKLYENTQLKTTLSENLFVGSQIATRPSPVTATLGGKTFVGWCASTADPTSLIVFPYTITGTETIWHAVYATPSDPSFTKLDDNNFDPDATYVLGAEQSSTDNTLWFKSTTYTVNENDSWGNAVQASASNIAFFTLSGTASALVAQDAAGNYIVAPTSNKNFKMSSTEGTLALQNDGTIQAGTTYYLYYNYNSGSGGFRMYNSSSSTLQPVYFYEYTPGSYSGHTTSIQSYGITEAECTNGSVDADVSSAPEATTVTITATPSAGYALLSFDVYKTGESSTKVDFTVDPDNYKQATFSMPAYAVTVSATFIKVGTAENPLTVAELIASQANLDGYYVYAQGVVSQLGSFNSTNGYYTYYFSADGTTTSQFEVYNGYKGSHQEGDEWYYDGFSAASDLALGDEVIVEGYIKYFNNTKYQFEAQNSELTYHCRPVVVTKGAETASEGTYTLTSGGNALSAKYCLADLSGENDLTVTVTASPQPGYRLKSITSLDGETVVGTVGAISNNSCTITGIKASTTITANFEQVFAVALTVNTTGTLHGDYTATINGDAGPVSVAAGETINLAASVVSADDEFVNWTATEGITIANATALSTTATATQAGTITANFRPLADPHTITNGGVDAAYGTIVMKDMEDNVAASLSLRPDKTGKLVATEEDGYRFTGWTVTPANAVTFADATAMETTFAATDVAATISASYEARTPFTVKFMNGNSQVGDDATVYDGRTIALLSAQTSFDANHTNFCGWATSNFDGVADTEPSFVTGTQTITDNTTFYAVYGNAVETNNYKQITYTNSLEGNYLIVAKGSTSAYAMKANIPNNKYNLAAQSVTIGEGDIISNPDAVLVWAISPSSSNVKFNNGDNWAKIYNDGNGHTNLILTTTDADNTFSVAQNGSTDAFVFTTTVSVGTNNQIEYYNNEFKPYNSQNADYPIYLYKQVLVTDEWVSKPIEYVNVYFKTNAGEEAVTNMPADITNVEKGYSLVAPSETPARGGYNFVGWNTDNEATVAMAFPKTINTNTTVYAIWQAYPDCAIDLYVNGVKDENISTAVKQGAELDLSAIDAPERLGYTFLGWAEAPRAEENTTAIDIVEAYTPTPNVDTQKSFYAVYTRQEGVARYEKVTTEPTDWSGKYLIVCENQNIAFDGSWDELDNAGNNFEVTIDESVIAYSEVTDAKTFTIAAVTGGYSIKSKSGYYVCGKGSGTNGMNSSTSTEYVNTISLTNDDNATIIGDGAYMRCNANNGNPWFRYFKSTTYTSQDPIQLYKYIAGTTYYTTNPAVNYNVSYNLAGGAWKEDEGCESAIVAANESYDVCADVPVKTDYIFTGWTVGGEAIGASITVTGTTEIVANYRAAEPYSVTYDANGALGTAPAAASVKEGANYTVLANSWFFKAGYSFAGWNTAADGTGTKYAKDAVMTMPSENVTLYAQWSNSLSERDVVIVAHYGNDYYAMGQTLNSSKQLNAVQVQMLNGKVRDVAEENRAAITWHMIVNSSNNTVSFYNPNNKKYLGYSGNDLAYADEAVEWTWDETKKCYKIGTEGGRTFWYRNSDATSTYNCFKYYSTGNVGASGYASEMILAYGFAVTIDGDATESAITVGDDVVVTEDAELTINNERVLNSLTVENGGKVTLSNKLTVVGTFTIETTMASGESGQLNGATASNFEAGEAYIDITLGDNGNPNKWHAFTVPFPVDAMNGIYDLDGNKLTNEVNYAIMEYLGDVRAQGKYGWKKIRTTLVPGTFYLMTVDGLRTTYRFKKTADGALVAGNTKDLEEYPLNGGTEEHNDNGWNGVGNPTLRYGQVAYKVQVLNPTSYTYEPFEANETNFVVGTPFFIQANAAAAAADMTFGAVSGEANYAPARTPAKGIESVKVTFGNEEYKDRLYISASEDALNRYETGKDLAKMTMTSTPKVAQIFGKAYNTKLCMVYAPMSNDQAVYDLTLYAPADGTYRIETPTENEDATLYLTKDGRAIWNLSMSACEVELSKGTTENYGLLLVRKTPGVATGMENVQSDNVQCTKVIIDNQVFILRGGQMYDLTGKKIEK